MKLVKLTIVNRGLTLGVRDGNFAITMCGQDMPNRRKIMSHFVGNQNGDGHFVKARSVRRLISSIGDPRVVVVVIGTKHPMSRLVSRLLPFLSSNSMVVSKNGSSFRSARHHIGRLRGGKVCFIKAKVSKNRRKTLRNPSIVPKNSIRT